MRKKVLKILSVILSAAMFFSLCSCGEKTSIEKIKKKGSLLLYTECGLPPYEFDYNNEIVGVDINIAKAVADELGVKLEIRDVNFDNILSGVQSGKADIGAAGITIRDDRKETLDFSVPYSSSEQYVVVSSDIELPTVQALCGKKLGYQQGTTSDFLVEDLIKAGKLTDVTVTGYNTPVIAAAALGKIDAVIADKLTAEIIVAGSNGSLHTGRLLNDGGSAAAEVEQYGIIVTKGNKELLDVVNTVVNRLLEDGTIEKWTEEFNTMAVA